MIIRNVPNEKRMRINLFNRRDKALPCLYLLIIKNIANETQKNPHKINNIQKGEIWQLPASNKNGPIFPISVKNFGEQLTPIPLIKGLKYQENGREKRIKEIIKVTTLIKNLIEKPKRKKKMIMVNKM